MNEGEKDYTMSDDASWIQRYWHQLTFALGTILWAVKLNLSVKDLERTVYDDHGDKRLVTEAYCEKCRTKCDEAHKDVTANLHRELQNIHASFRDMQNTLADMQKNMVTIQTLKEWVK